MPPFYKMPFRWIDNKENTLEIWEHNSLTKEGFKKFIYILLFFMSLPLIVLIGTMIFWVMLLFISIAFIGMYFAIFLNKKNRKHYEILEIKDDDVLLYHYNGNKEYIWNSNKYWTNIKIHPNNKIKNYITLRGNTQREVELVRF